MKKTEIIIISLFVIIISMSCYILILALNQERAVRKRAVEFEMLSVACFGVDENLVYGGVYNKDNDFYCVMGGDRGVEEHEFCHSLVRNDYSHFCGVINYG